MKEPPTRSLLESERKSALDRVQTLKTELSWLAGDSEEANGDDEHDPEGSTLAFERARVAGLLGDAEANLKHLDDALTKLATGTYGVCEDCGKAISPDRLEALPAARSCFDCAVMPRPG
jgi:RNA polymerase-binding transcription factor DksA